MIYFSQQLIETQEKLTEDRRTFNFIMGLRRVNGLHVPLHIPLNVVDGLLGGSSLRPGLKHQALGFDVLGLDALIHHIPKELV